MASQWFCKVLGQEVGPVGFRDMAEMVRAGTLKEADQVRRKGTSEWIPARDVIGLFRAAKKEPAQAAPAAPEPKPPLAPDQPPAKGQPAAPPRRIRKRHVSRDGARAAVGGGVGVGMAGQPAKEVSRAASRQTSICRQRRVGSVSRYTSRSSLRSRPRRASPSAGPRIGGH